MISKALVLAVGVGVAAMSGCVVVKDRSSSSSGERARQKMENARTDINWVLDALHESASKADGQRYFWLFAGDAVFLGTAWEERWTKKQFQDYAMARFETGTGWTYSVVARNVEIAKGGTVAWFDERLNNAKYGECRGTGVLVFRDSRWQIAQYNLTTPVPNDLLPSVAEQIREYEAKQGAK